MEAQTKKKAFNLLFYFSSIGTNPASIIPNLGFDQVDFTPSFWKRSYPALELEIHTFFSSLQNKISPGIDGKKLLLVKASAFAIVSI